MTSPPSRLTHELPCYSIAPDRSISNYEEKRVKTKRSHLVILSNLGLLHDACLPVERKVAVRVAIFAFLWSKFLEKSISFLFLRDLSKPYEFLT
jgi:hypothetical protein